MSGCRFRVTLLGTGVPIPSPERFGPCTLVEAGDRKFLIDAGRGAAIRLYQLKIPLGRIDLQLLTHFHSDHTSGLPDLWLTGWLSSSFGARTAPYRVVGPPGTRTLVENLERAYAADIKIRIADEKLPPAGVRTEVTEFDRDGVVYQEGGVKAIAFEVDHGDVIKPCYGYRFEYGGRVVVLSADTRYNENVIRHGAGADLLIHDGVHPWEWTGEVMANQAIAAGLSRRKPHGQTPHAFDRVQTAGRSAVPGRRDALRARQTA